MNRTALYFSAPYRTSCADEPVPELPDDQLLIKSRYSAISAGTELLVYRGRMPGNLKVDTSIQSLSRAFGYPIKYGYAVVGQVEAVGSAVDPQWRGKSVFAFHPHETRFGAHPDDVLEIPDNVTAENALFLPNMETAVNLVMDARPLIGEQVIVLGQGVVGLLVTALLSHFPLQNLVTLDRYETRRKQSMLAGARLSLDPDDPSSRAHLKDQLAQSSTDGAADLIFELSGSPAALDRAITLAGYATRIVVGSWYGTRRARLDLGGGFHRNRIQIISSQVSTLAPKLSGRWTKSRRFASAWEMIRQIDPVKWISHRFALADAADAYDLLDRRPQEALQVIFEHC